MTTLLTALAAGALSWLLFGAAEKLLRWKRTDSKRPDLKAHIEARSTDKPPTAKEQPIYYSEIRLSAKQTIWYTSLAGAVLFAIAYIFYKNIGLSVLFMCFGVLYPKTVKRRLLARRKNQLVYQFRQALYSMSSSLAAGKSIENAIGEVIADLNLLYQGANPYMIREFKAILHKIQNGETVEKAFHDFSLRADVEAIASFAEVLAICKRTGGNLIEVVRKTSDMINEKLEIQQEIAVMVAQKRFEAKTISVIPFAIVAFLSFCSPDYMAPLYSFQGGMLMTFALLVLAGCRTVIQRIMDIRV